MFFLLSCINAFQPIHLLHAINDYRLGKDLHKLNINDALTNAAGEQSENMVLLNKVTHKGTEKSKVAVDRAIKHNYINILNLEEIVDVINDDDLEFLMRKWKKEVSKNEVLLEDFTDIGISIRPTNTGKKYITVLLGKQTKF